MREMRSYGSVRGATRESRPYRDQIWRLEISTMADGRLAYQRTLLNCKAERPRFSTFAGCATVQRGTDDSRSGC